jgi:uncharacterized spore protein YtfJ
MYNELFESVIRTSGENTDDIDDFDDRDNFWAPVPEIEQLFEQVLREMEISPNDFAFKLQTFFISYLKIDLTPNFYKKLATEIVSDFLKNDKTKEGLILVSDDRTIKFIDGTKNVITETRKFVDDIIARCKKYALLWSGSDRKLGENQIKFIQYFGNEDYVNEMIPELVKAISEAPPQNKKAPSNYRTRPGYSGP